MNNFGEKVSFLWSVADLLRGPCCPNQYKDIILPAAEDYGCEFNPDARSEVFGQDYNAQAYTIYSSDLMKKDQNKEVVDEYIKCEVLPHLLDAFMADSKTKIDYEINFNRYFYTYTSPRPLSEIEVDLKKIKKEIADILVEVTE